MGILLQILKIAALIILGLVVLVAIGFQVQPRPFSPFSQRTPALRTVPLPAGLPAPVERFYRVVYGDEIPVIELAVITGRAAMRPAGPFMLPGRFRFSHNAGQGYRHYIEMTLFGFPILKVNERYVDGKSLARLPFGVSVDNDPNTNQGAALGLWAELVWMPSIFITDPRVHWEPVDDHTALLVVPFENAAETFVVRFNPDTGLIAYLESMRYHGAESKAKTLWINEAREWSTFDGKPFQKKGAAIWMDDGKAWAVFEVDEVVYNVDVQEYLYAEGE